MEHDDVIEQLELAAVEPDGLARLMAGDTAIAAAVAGHLAGCDACTTEFERLGRAAPLLRDVVRTTPPADLRERTLAYVRERGEPRGAVTGVAPTATASVASPAAGGPVASPVATAVATPVAGRRRATSRILPWVASLAAAILIAVAGTSYLADQQAAERLADHERALQGLEAVASATIAITGEPDAKRVDLAAAEAGSWGSLLFSPATTKLVVVAEGLERPPAGKEYRCWMEVSGKRENVGRMYFADDLAFWVGDTPAISRAEPGTTFGVSLADLDGSALDAPPVLAGEL